WLKSYLSFGDDRPLWGFVADEILAKGALAEDLNIDEALRHNMYLQSWRPKIVGSNLSADLKQMVKIGDKYDVRMGALAISREAQRKAIIWNHADRARTRVRIKTRHNKVNECLKVNHNMMSVDDAETIARKLGTARHRAREDCKCNACNEERTRYKCKAPHKCFVNTREMESAFCAP
ncbi:hypothetical protein B0H19DRAFT_962629, partial [Mycena capillaripes]